MACPHLLPKTATLYPETGDFVAFSGDFVAVFGNKCGQAFKHIIFNGWRITALTQWRRRNEVAQGNGLPWVAISQ